jgi:hypothetical protein
MEQLTAHSWIVLPLAARFPGNLKIFQLLPIEILSFSKKAKWKISGRNVANEGQIRSSP